MSTEKLDYSRRQDRKIVDDALRRMGADGDLDDLPTLSGVPITPETARDLARVAKQVETTRQRRDALIVQAHAEGGGLREIARIAGLTHRAVTKIIERLR